MARSTKSRQDMPLGSLPQISRSQVRAPSIREVAELAQVGLGTVSRVINGGQNVSERTSARVLAAISELGYVPDIVAQSMRNHRSMTFACIVRDFTVPVLGMFVDAMQKTIDSEGYSLIVASSYHDLKREVALLQRLHQRRIDGLVITTSSETAPELLSLLRTVNFPVVLLDRESPAEVDAVIIDHARGTSLAIANLIQLGHRRIAFMSGERDLHPTTNRLGAYKAALKAAGIPRVPELIRISSFAAEAGYAQARELLAMDHPPTAVMAGGSAYLPGLIRAARERGLKIPHDLSIVVGAESDMALLMEPAITTVRWDHDRLGQAAGRLLIDRLADPGRPPTRLVFESELVMGGSCAPPRTPAQ